MSDEHDPVIQFTIPATKIERIRDLAQSILEPTITYIRDPLEMTRRAVEANADAAVSILALLSNYST